MEVIARLSTGALSSSATSKKDQRVPLVSLKKQSFFLRARWQRTDGRLHGGRDRAMQEAKTDEGMDAEGRETQGAVSEGHSI